MKDGKVFASGLSLKADWKEACEELSLKLRLDLGGAPCDFLIFFVSELYSNLDPLELTSAFGRFLSCPASLGCNSSGVIGDQSEVEMEPAISAMAMHLPGVRLNAFSLTARELQEMERPTDLIHQLDVYPIDHPRFILLADPLSTDIDKCLNLFNRAYQGMPIIGGLASGIVAGASNWLAVSQHIYREGIVGLALTGDIALDVVVAQGCRPIGDSMIITRAKGNTLLELGGRPAFLALREILEKLPEKDRQLARHSLFVGLAMSENRPAFQQGDFLIRNIMGIDPARGAIVIGAQLNTGQTLQFQLRDAETSDEDLKKQLEKIASLPREMSKGALLVSCCGRGKGLYGEPSHDVRVIQTLGGPLKLSGFFANGEIGPVGDRNYVHGYTSSLALLH